MRARFVAFVAACIVVVACAGALPAAAGPKPTGTGVFYLPGVLGLGPALGLVHFCSGAAVAGGDGDLVITAAHCAFGLGIGDEFVPGATGRATPSGVWDVDRVYVDPQWKATHDPRHDVAFVHVVPHGHTHLADVVDARPLGQVPADGTDVTVTGYPAGLGLVSPPKAVSCTTPVTSDDGYPTIHCHGFTDGVSGGPWVAGGAVVGVTGGLNEGGCVDTVTHTAPFGAQARALLARAERGGRGDLAPVAFQDGC